MESWERESESNCKHDQQNNLLRVQSPFKCKSPKVIFSVEFLAARYRMTEVFFLLFK